MNTLEEQLLQKIAVLNEVAWENRVNKPVVDNWLSNFTGASAANSHDNEQRHALYLLSQFIYFGSQQIRELLRFIYRDLYKYPIVEEIRKNHSDTLDSDFITRAFNAELSKTKFLGIGNPSESGSHLLYFFRQENHLPKTSFINTYEIFANTNSKKSIRKLKMPAVRRYVFIDDFCGSGDQARQYSKTVLSELRRLDPSVRTSYLVLFATATGLKVLRKHTKFDDIHCVVELDDTFKCFGTKSRFFSAPPMGIAKTFAETMCRYYGNRFYGTEPLGYSDSQLLLGFHHNTPDNTLPIMWYSEDIGPHWIPAFRRYPKIYGSV